MTTVPKVDYAAIKVLVIDDESHTRSIIRSQLHLLGVREIAEAGDGKQGLVQTLRIKPHIIFCDIHMAPVSGLEFLVGLRSLKMDGVKDLPVIFLTADAKSDTVIFAKEHKVDGYLVKPVAAAQLKAHIDAMVEKGGIKLDPTSPPPPTGGHYTFPKRD